MQNNRYNGNENDHSRGYGNQSRDQYQNNINYAGGRPRQSGDGAYRGGNSGVSGNGGGRKPGGNYKLRIVLTVVLCLLAVGLVVLVALLVRMAGHDSSDVSGSADFTLNTPAAISTSPSESPSESVSAPDFVTDAATTAPVTSAPSTSGSSTVTPPETIKPSTGGDPVDNSFFSDALFIGDSRTKGLMLSGDIKCDWYATESLHVSTALVKKFVSIDGAEYTVSEALQMNSGKYKKIYIGLGVNDLGYAPSNFIAYYSNVVSAIKAICPDADIYAMAIIPVSKERSDKNLYGVTNEKVAQFNAKLAESADEMGVIFLNVAEPFTKADGTLIDGTGSPDGVHLGASGYKIQCDYIRSHTKK